MKSNTGFNPERLPVNGKKQHCQNSAASEVVGEMLMIGLVVVLVAVFASVLWNTMPATRNPGVTLMVKNDSTHLVLWHKGGDWIRADEITVIIGDDHDTRIRYSHNDPAFHMFPDKDVFDVGSNITIDFPSGFSGDETINLVTPRALVFSGRLQL